jgi:hypothetical protein
MEWDRELAQVTAVEMRAMGCVKFGYENLRCWDMEMLGS